MNPLLTCCSSRKSAIRAGILGLVGLGLLGIVASVVLPVWRARSANVLEEHCRDLRDREQWAELERTAEAWCHREPQRASAWLFRAEAAAGQNDFQGAADALFQVPKSDDRALPAYMKGAELLLGQGNRPLEGIKALERLVQMEPRLGGAHRHLIQFSALTLQRQQLIQQVRTAIEHRREPREAYVYLFLIDTLRLTNGVEMNTKWLEAYPDHELFLVARALHMDEVRVAERGSAARAVEPTLRSTSIREQLLDDLFRRFPNNRELLAHHIERALVAGDTARVVKVLKTAPASIDEDNRFWRYKGQVHETRKEFKDAETAYRQALKLNPLDWSTMNRLAHIERIHKRYGEVERLQRLVQQADKLRESVRKFPAAEHVGREWLEQFAVFAERAGDGTVARSLADRLGGIAEETITQSGTQDFDKP